MKFAIGVQLESHVNARHGSSHREFVDFRCRAHPAPLRPCLLWERPRGQTASGTPPISEVGGMHNPGLASHIASFLRAVVSPVCRNCISESDMRGPGSVGSVVPPRMGRGCYTLAMSMKSPNSGSTLCPGKGVRNLRKESPYSASPAEEDHQTSGIQQETERHEQSLLSQVDQRESDPLFPVGAIQHASQCVMV